MDDHTLPCVITASRTDPRGKTIRLKATINGAGDITGAVLRYFIEYVKDKDDWLGVRVTCKTPFGEWSGEFARGAAYTFINIIV